MNGILNWRKKNQLHMAWNVASPYNSMTMKSFSDMSAEKVQRWLLSSFTTILSETGKYRLYDSNCDDIEFEICLSVEVLIEPKNSR